MRIIAAFCLAALCAGVPVSAQETGMPRRASACAGESWQDRLTGVTAEGDLMLASERVAKLSAVRLPDDEALRRQTIEWLKARTDLPVLLDAHGEPDRWGRAPVRVRLSKDFHSLDLGHGLVEAGLGIVDPGAAQAFCQPELLALEETARERHLGLWGDDRYNPIPADQHDRLQGHVGRFVLVEGRVRSVGERKQRIYLNFGGHWAEDFTIIIPRKAWSLMARRGLGADSLKGQTIRARGILQSWQGTALAIDLPEMIERLEGNRLAR